jgi:hypothetical protein
MSSAREHRSDAASSVDRRGFLNLAGSAGLLAGAALGPSAMAADKRDGPAPTPSDPVKWAQESCDRRDDPLSGARIVQLTSAAAISNNIYGEQPYCSPDGKRIVIARCQDFCWDEEGSLLVHELDSLRITMVVRRMKGVRGVFNAAWSGLVYYWTPDRKLMRLSLTTLQQKEVYVEEDPAAPLPAGSVSPDQRYVIGTAPRLKGKGAPVFQVLRLDLKTKTREVIFEHPEICNPHLQFNPVHGREILVQNNVGVRLKEDGSLDTYQTKGCRLFVIDADGSRQRYLPAGPPVTRGLTGHECFVADTGRVLFSAGWVRHSDYDWRQDPLHPEGNLFTAGPDDAKPTGFHAPEYFFNHLCASQCGRYFVADAWQGSLFRNGRLQSVSLVVGNLKTGKHRVLVEDAICDGGGNQCTHAHPYFTADSRHVIFNANPCHSTPQVYAARVPNGFLESLA